MMNNYDDELEHRLKSDCCITAPFYHEAIILCVVCVGFNMPFYEVWNYSRVSKVLISEITFKLRQ